MQQEKEKPSQSNGTAPSNSTTLAGVAPVKAEYLIIPPTSNLNPNPNHNRNSHNQPQTDKRALPDDDEAESRTNHVSEAQSQSQSQSQAQGDGSDSKRIKLDADADADGESKRNGEYQRGNKTNKGNKQRGQNHGRKFNKISDQVDLCSKVILGKQCPFGDSCRFSHDIPLYLSTKPPDVQFPPPPVGGVDGSLWSLAPSTKGQYLDRYYQDSDPFCHLNREQEHQVDQDGIDPEAGVRATRNQNQSQHSSETIHYCPSFFQRGKCNSGYKCRFLASHSVKKTVLKDGKQVEVLELSTDQRQDDAERDVGGQRDAEGEGEGDDGRKVSDERNYISFESLKMIQKKSANLYPFNLSDQVLSILEKEPTDYSADSSSKPFGRIPVDFDRLKREGEIKYAESLEILKERKLNGSGGGGGREKKGKNQKSKESSNGTDGMDQDELEEMMMNQSSSTNSQRLDPISRSLMDSTPSSSIDVSRIRLPEKKRLDWQDKLYLAPLTTVGNLPFRRICSTFGSDIHCSEMALSESLLGSNKSEWSLLRRHANEKIFGAQICGSKPRAVVPAAEVLMREFGHGGLDFVDLNCGCPIDLIFNKGSGSALLDHSNKLGKILRGVSTVLGEIPVTVKLRNGTNSNKNTSHKLFPRLQHEFSVGAVTLHGRSRQQRYKHRADWNYIKTCTDSLRESLLSQREESRFADVEEMNPIPIFGNGDVYSWQEYYENKELTGVDGEMLARGALIKPWLFTEIKERKDWDISARERLDIFRQFSEYGLSHWGTDTLGVNTTRRFLCEAMSFTHRYIPIGILETLPSKLNDRPPLFRGRNQLETLLASDNVKDWIKISEMFLGKTPDDWNFVPKHKSSSYDKGAEVGENQG